MRNRSDGQGTGVPQSAFGVLVIVLGIIVAATPIGQAIPNRGFAHALDIPMWILGLAVIPFGGLFVWAGIRRNRSR